jgi:hypothetical protein
MQSAGSAVCSYFTVLFLGAIYIYMKSACVAVVCVIFKKKKRRNKRTLFQVFENLSRERV